MTAEPMTDAEWYALRAESRQALPDAVAEAASLPSVLLPYQARLLATTATHQLVVCEKSRRIGMTWAVGADAALTAGASRGAGGSDVLYIGYNLDMAPDLSAPVQTGTIRLWGRA